jgi:DMSO/TMAO reductase YedYZ heme-binding membrane subunit
MWRDRFQHHLALVATTGIVLIAAVVSGPLAAALDRLSIVSAYLCMGYLCAALLIGPRQAIQSGRVAINDFLRRDIGIWAALVGFGHFYLAIILSMNSEYLDLFVYADDLSYSEQIRDRLYSFGAISGFVVGILFVLLLALSNNRSSKLIGATWWKRMQRTSYLAFVFTITHAVAFQILESRQDLLIGVVVFVFAVTLAGQLFGIAAVLKRVSS